MSDERAHTVCEYHYDIVQKSPEWLTIRNGKATSSRIQCVASSNAVKGRSTYAYELAYERVFGYSVNSFSNGDIERGNKDEPIARAWYEFTHDIDVVEIGFVSDMFRDYGGSPDGLVGDDGIIEIKSKRPYLIMPIHDRGEVPSEYIAQIHGNLLVTNREWCDFIAYSEGLDPFIKRVYRDEKYINKLDAKIDKFLEFVEEITENMRRKAV